MKIKHCAAVMALAPLLVLGAGWVQALPASESDAVESNTVKAPAIDVSVLQITSQLSGALAMSEAQKAEFEGFLQAQIPTHKAIEAKVKRKFKQLQAAAGNGASERDVKQLTSELGELIAGQAQHRNQTRTYLKALLNDAQLNHLYLLQEEGWQPWSTEVSKHRPVAKPMTLII